MTEAHGQRHFPEIGGAKKTKKKHFSFYCLRRLKIGVRTNFSQHRKPDFTGTKKIRNGQKSEKVAILFKMELDLCLFTFKATEIVCWLLFC
jgi:hypothetical protein